MHVLQLLYPTSLPCRFVLQVPGIVKSTTFCFPFPLNITNLGEPTQPKGNLRIMPILGLTFHLTIKLLRVIIKFVKDILVSNIRGFFQIRKSPLPLNPTIILQDVPNDLMCFLNGPLQSIKKHIVSLAPNTP
jgi:hypothetical protein